MEENINEYMEFFKSQPLIEKQKIIYEQLQLLAGLTNNMCKELDIPNELILNKELLDLKKEDYTQDDFAEAIIVLINSIQNSVCDYFNGITSLLNALDNKQGE